MRRGKLSIAFLFTYQGVIVSNGDLGYQGNELAVNYTGNNHGGLVEIDGEVYIFWYRQTHGTGFSRQGCADRVQIAEDGTIPQIEITSCGLNGGPLPAKNTYLSYIACHLTEKDRSAVGHVVEPALGQMFPKLPADMPYITEEEDTDYEKGFKPYITNLREGAVAGFKYFAFDGDSFHDHQLLFLVQLQSAIDDTPLIRLWTLSSPGMIPPKMRFDPCRQLRRIVRLLYIVIRSQHKA